MVAKTYPAQPGWEESELELGGVKTVVMEAGEGPPLLFLHGCDGPRDFSDYALLELARRYRVIAPWHPGFGPSIRPAAFRDVSDLAYFYLDLIDAWKLRGVTLVGASIGGWIAAEIAVRNSSSIDKLVLSGPLGVKAGDRTTRDYLDFFTLPRAEWPNVAFASPEKAVRDVAMMTEAELTHMARNTEALAYYAWKPFLHNPQLANWLHRVNVPTLVIRGAQDRITSRACHELYAQSIPGASLCVIAEAGHYPHIEQPVAFAKAML
ncbi:MAG: alpha/beta hydrolase [Betaproteobacteria bacterium]|nr:alpha/beta hydrolase [Betaproteobacteria bacterium]